MFSLRGRGSGDAKFHETNENGFGWWLNKQDVPISSDTNKDKDLRSSGSSSSMLSCVDSDDTESYTLAQDFEQESCDNCERIELTSLIYEDLDVDLIEKDALTKTANTTPFAAKEALDVLDKLDSKSRRSQGICYTPERLVRSQEYRILTPSPRYLSVSQAKITPEHENPRNVLRCRRRLNYLIDSKQVGATQLKVILDTNPSETLIPTVTPIRRRNYKQADININEKNMISKNIAEDSSNVVDRRPFQLGTPFSLESPDSFSKGSSLERLNVTWEDCKKMTTRSSSLEDTSGIQSNDWSSDTPSDVQSTPLCLGDELAIASTNCKPNVSQDRGSAINEVVSILEVLETDPDKAAILLEEDRFCDSSSSHDQLTRLALAIETDANVPGVRENPEHLVQHLQRKVEKLQANSRDIYKDICTLRKNFQCDEKRMADISSGVIRLREDVHEMRYLDDLLNLLRGELERISRRNWPFIIGHTEHHSEEMNLIV